MALSLYRRIIHAIRPYKTVKITTTEQVHSTSQKTTVTSKTIGMELGDKEYPIGTTVVFASRTIEAGFSDEELKRYGCSHEDLVTAFGEIVDKVTRLDSIKFLTIDRMCYNKIQREKELGTQH